ncbi:hypothetical protein ASD39_05955 [Sphingomonas sp. Root50]|nr:hypothetical protein ASD17_03435 [Sphingomonas sp. Root1294]KQY68222.1 hypothetical protein ASD39_05955 [Sphingomonas sp. Root50]KRB91118.1 hypothetical protein ASE22_12750 [Sphingomonas sp. Root720]
MLLLSTALCLVASPAFAQAANDDGTTEIIVTAQKRSERLSEVPLAITAATGAQLQVQGITTTADLTKIVPSLTVQISEYGVPVFSIRGVGYKDFSIGATPAVATYMDQVSLPYSVLTRGATLDLERVEVLKGPQGTLFGQNSTGGAINYIAAKPTDSFHAGGLLNYGRFNRVELEGFVSGPLNDTLAFRLAVRHESQGAWQKSFTRDDELGRVDFTNARLLVDWKPTETLGFQLNVSGWRDQSETQSAQFQRFTPSRPTPGPLTQGVFNALTNYPVSPRNNRAADWDNGVSFERDDKFYMLSLRGDWDMASDLTLSSITGYVHYKGEAPFDSDGTDYPNLRIHKYGFVESFSQELRLSGSSGPLKYMVGANYQDETVNEYSHDIFFSSNVTAGPYYFPSGDRINNQKIETKSIFGSLDYAITPTLTLSGSARYSDQKRRFEGCFADYGNGQAALAFSVFSGVVLPNGSCLTLEDSTLKSLPIVASDLDEDNVSWRGVVSWKPATDTLLYASLTRGYKAGSYTVPAAAFASQFTPVTQESVLTYEAGAKLGLFDRKVQLTSAAFYYDYTNKQLAGTVINPFFGPVSQLVNIPKSRVYGAELELLVTLVRGLRLSAGATYLNSRVKEDPRPPAQPRDPLGRVNSFVGESFPNTPKWLLVGDAQYDFPIRSDMDMFVGGNISYRSSTAAAFGDGLEFAIAGYSLIDLRAGFAARDGLWRVQFYGRNVTNKYYWTGVPRNLDTIVRFAGQPATYGVQVSFRL